MGLWYGYGYTNNAVIVPLIQNNQAVFIAHGEAIVLQLYRIPTEKGIEVLPTSYSQPFWTMEYQFGNFRLLMFPI